MADEERRDVVGEMSGPPASSRRSQQTSDSSDSSGSTVFSPSSQSSSSTSTAIIEPSSDESLYYFFGLAGNPILVARSSNTAFVPQFDMTFRRRKRVFNIGRHPIIQMYEQGPRTKIRSAFAGLVDFIAIDIVRIGYSDAAMQNPVVVLVKIPKTQTDAPNAIVAVKRCRDILLIHGLNDVHVEIMSSNQFSRGFTDHSSTPALPYERVPRIGQSIGPQVAGEIHASGTLGMYLNIIFQDKTSARCALTCHHVAFPSNVRNPANGENQAHLLGDSNVFRMEQPSFQDHEATQDALRNTINSNQDLCNSLLTRQENAEQGMCAPLSQRQIDAMNSYRQAAQKAISLLKDVQNFSDRFFGTVMTSSGISTDPNHGNTVDWALIAIDSNRVNRFPSNILPEMNFGDNLLAKINNKLRSHNYLKPLELPSEVQGVVAFAEICNPQVIDIDGFPSLRVMKYGRTTHWSTGISNEILSDCQREPGRISKEWCILDSESCGTGRFSEGGDSGAIVMDYNGRIAGMLHGGGFPTSSGIEMTYVTPIAWVFESIQRKLSVRVEI